MANRIRGLGAAGARLNGAANRLPVVVWLYLLPIEQETFGVSVEAKQLLHAVRC